MASKVAGGNGVSAAAVPQTGVPVTTTAGAAVIGNVMQPVYGSHGHSHHAREAMLAANGAAAMQAGGYYMQPHGLYLDHNGHPVYYRVG